MLWRTHLRIANEVLKDLGIPKWSSEGEQLRNGILAPDKWGDYPHHYGKSDAIIKHVLEARRLFLKSDLVNSCFRLGIALHYIQDSYASIPPRSRYHQAWEQEIEDSYFVDDLEGDIEWAFQNRRHLIKPYSEIARTLSREIQGKQESLRLATLLGHEPPREWGKPRVDFNLALRASLRIARAVLGPRNNQALEQDLHQTLVSYESLLRKTETAFADTIVGLIKKRDNLKERVRNTRDVTSRMNDFFLSLVIGVRGFQVSRKLKKYDQKEHLDNVAKEYRRVAQQKSAPHVGWYVFEIPEINVDIVEKDLLPNEEISQHFELNGDSIGNLIGQGRITCYSVGNRDFVRRRDLDKIMEARLKTSSLLLNCHGFG